MFPWILLYRHEAGWPNKTPTSVINLRGSTREIYLNELISFFEHTYYRYEQSEFFVVWRHTRFSWFHVTYAVSRLWVHVQCALCKSRLTYRKEILRYSGYVRMTGSWLGAILEYKGVSRGHIYRSSETGKVDPISCYFILPLWFSVDDFVGIECLSCMDKFLNTIQRDVFLPCPALPRMT